MIAQYSNVISLTLFLFLYGPAKMIEPTEFSHTVFQYSNEVYRTCRRHTNSREAAWDAYQDTFLALTRKQNDLDLSTSLGPWLRETARRCSLSVSRDLRRHRHVVLYAELSECWADTAPDRTLAELTEILAEEITELPDQDQELLSLLYVDALTHSNAAAQLDIPNGSVHARVSQIHKKLRRRMKKRDVALGLFLLLFLLDDAGFAGTLRVTKPKPIGREVGPWTAGVAILTTALLVSMIVDPDFLSHAVATIQVELPMQAEMTRQNSAGSCPTPLASNQTDEFRMID